MSIVISDVRKKAVAHGVVHTLFDGLDLRIEEGSRVGVLGPSKSGKSTLLKLICGTEEPNSGRVKRGLRASWPIPLNSFFVATSTVALNIRFIARLYGMKGGEFPRRVVESVEIGEFLNKKLNDCPPSVKSRLAFALAVWTDFDVYLFDDRILPREKEFQERAGELLGERLAGRGSVVATGNPKEVEGRCDSIYVLERGRAIHFADVAEGVAYFNEVFGKKKKGAAELAATTDKGEDAGDDGSNDVDMLAAAISAVED